jgi:hypothetical protein
MHDENTDALTGEHDGAPRRIRREVIKKVEKKKKRLSEYFNTKPIRITDRNVDQYELIYRVDDDGLRRFNAKVGDEIYVRQYRYNLPSHKLDWHVGYITRIDDDGYVQWFDKVNEGYNSFDWKAENLFMIVKMI